MSIPLITDQQKIQRVLSRGVAEVLPSRTGLAQLMQQRPIRLYMGIDPTGALLTLGHAVGLRKLQEFAKMGHQVILLVGNGTVRIGDPTGRDESRPMLSNEEIESNFQNWKNQASKILDFDLIEIRRNGDWLDQLDYLQIIKLLAKTTVAQLLERDMFQERMKKSLPIFGHEIIYPLMQGYDSVAMDVDLEIGGTDQTFNMMMGRHLQNQYHQHEKWVLSTPLIEGTDGRKMSKSFNNYVALTEPARDMYGKLMSLSDDLIIKYFTVLTDIDDDEISAMDQAIKAGTNPMQLKKKLAYQITSWLHDASAADKAAQFFQATVQEEAIPDASAFGTLAIQEIKKTDGKTSYSLVAKPVLSSSEIIRRIEQGAAKILTSGKNITSRAELLSLANGTEIKLGKRAWYRIVKVA